MGGLAVILGLLLIIAFVKLIPLLITVFLICLIVKAVFCGDRKQIEYNDYDETEL